MIARSICLLILISSIVLGLVAAVTPKGKSAKVGGPISDQSEELPDPVPPPKPPKDAEMRFQWNKRTSHSSDVWL